MIHSKNPGLRSGFFVYVDTLQSSFCRFNMVDMAYIQRMAVLAVTVGVLSIAGFATVASANHSWGGYHWARTANPFTLKLGDNVSSTWDSYLGAASTDWSVSTVLDTQITVGAGKRNCGPIAGRVEVCASKYGNNGWLGIASIWISGTHIVQGTVKMNDTYFNSSFYNKASWRQMVLCQEVGHTFGLGHQDEGFYNSNLGTCMDYTNDPARNDGLGNNLHPNVHDYSMLETIYAHLDSSTTIAQSTSQLKGRAALDEELGDDQTTWGKEIKRSADGRASLFEKDFGNGEKVFRHVFWAESRKGTLNK